MTNEAFEEWQVAFDSACAAQNFPSVCFPEFKMIRVYYDWEAPEISREQPHYTPEELSRMQEAFQQPPALTINECRNASVSV